MHAMKAYGGMGVQFMHYHWHYTEVRGQLHVPEKKSPLRTEHGAV